MITPEQAESIRGQILEQIDRLPEGQRNGLKEQFENATAEQLEAYVKQQSQGGECLFCGIGKGTVDTLKVYENSDIVAFLDITPAVPGQIIIIPKEHYQFIFQVPDNILWDMIRIMKIIMPVMVNAIKCQGISVYIAQGPAAGQRIGHAAINLIPRLNDDKAVFAWDRKDFARDELEKAMKEIKMGIDKTLSEERAKIEKKIREEMASSKPPQAKMALGVPKPELPEYPRRRA